MRRGPKHPGRIEHPHPASDQQRPYGLAGDVEYEGSLTLDADLMDACGMVPYERIDVYDVDNANRFSTYLIEGRRGSGECCVNGAAARLVRVGHKVIIAAYCAVDEAEVRAHRPRVVLVDAANRITVVKDREEAAARVKA